MITRFDEVGLERLVVSHAAEPMVHGNSLGGWRLLIYTSLVSLLVAGAWARFHTQLSSLILASVDDAASTRQVRGLVELGLVAASENDAVLATMNLPASDASVLASALRSRRLRLVRLPLVDASPAATDGSAPTHSVQLNVSGYSTVVQLSRTPIAVALPIGQMGEVTFSTMGETVRVGALGLSGPVALPLLSPGQALVVGIVAQ